MMKYIKRSLFSILEQWFFRNKALIVFGARQVGKTTLMKEILDKYPDKSLYLNCEAYSVQESFSKLEPAHLKSMIGNSKLVVFDEAQRLDNIGLVLKLLHDSYPDIQLIATGSSSFDLSSKVNEPLTGRALEFILYPISFLEMTPHIKRFEFQSFLEQRLRFGMYPEILDYPDNEARMLMDNLTGKYLYKDIFEFETIRKPKILTKLLQMIALQVGSEVSLNELAVSLQLNRDTVERYIDMLEKAFVLFRMNAFSRNLRSEISKKFKIYFYDVGVRNSLISNFNELTIRQDIGGLWENFLISERIKFNQAAHRNPNMYFWRTHSGNEIDYIEEIDNKISAFEFKYKPKGRQKAPHKFLKAYPNSTYELISIENYQQFILGE